MESLCIPFTFMEHGIKINMVPTKYGGLGGMTVDGDFIPFEFDNEKVFIKIKNLHKKKWTCGKIPSC